MNEAESTGKYRWSLRAGFGRPCFIWCSWVAANLPPGNPACPINRPVQNTGTRHTCPDITATRASRRHGRRVRLVATSRWRCSHRFHPAQVGRVGAVVLGEQGNVDRWCLECACLVCSGLRPSRTLRRFDHFTGVVRAGFRQLRRYSWRRSRSCEIGKRFRPRRSPDEARR